MAANYFTKALQGSLFIKLRKLIMDYFHPRTLLEIFPSLDEERVGNITNLATSGNVKFGGKIGTKLENWIGPSVLRIGTRVKDLI